MVVLSQLFADRGEGNSVAPPAAMLRPAAARNPAWRTYSALVSWLTGDQPGWHVSIVRQLASF